MAPVCAVETGLNPQAAYGADLMTRIQHDLHDPERALTHAIREMLGGTCGRFGEAREVLVQSGFPLITPADNVSPAGNAPDVIVQLYGGVPPVAAKVSEYAVPTVPMPRGDAVLMETGVAA